MTGLLGAAACGGGGNKGGEKDASTNSDGASHGDGDKGGDGDSSSGDGDGGKGSSGDGDASSSSTGGDGGNMSTADGGSGPTCSASCNDNNDCTTDSCIATDVCAHKLEPTSCAAGSSCHPKDGCTTGTACDPSKAGACADMDSCTTNERCDATTDQCAFDPLDNDKDGYAPKVCGGADCNDNDPRIHPGATETCNGVDDNCDGQIDNMATCAGDGEVCEKGQCVCGTGLNQCGGGRQGPIGCYDFKTDAQHCGNCNTDCGSAGVCTNNACSCPSPGTMCHNAQTNTDSCVDINTDFNNCGKCGKQCQYGQTCQNKQCVACGTDGAACCSPSDQLSPGGCALGLTCSGTPGTAGAACGCTSPSAMCPSGRAGVDLCVNLKTSLTNCGICGKTCNLAAGESCVEGACKVACGTSGLACCGQGNYSYCVGSGGGPDSKCPPSGTCP